MDEPVHYQKPNPVDSANPICKLFFWWLNPLFKKGYQKDLDVIDLYRIPKNDSSEMLGNRLQRKWEEELQKQTLGDKAKLRTALIKCFFIKFMLVGLACCFEECFTRIVQPIFLGGLIRYFTPGSETTSTEAILYATGVAVCSGIFPLTHHPYFFGVQHTAMQIRVACCSLIYRKAIRLSQAALGQTTIGQMVNLLSNDVNRFDQSILYLHYLWVGPIQTIITVGILWWMLGPSCLAGILVLLLFVPLQGWMGNIFAKLRLQVAELTDERVRIMNEIVSGMRIIKMYTWENPFSEAVENARRREMGVITKTSYYRAFNIAIYFTSSKLILFLTFLTYVLSGNSLTAEKVFVTVALYNNIRMIMTLLFPFAVAQGAETLVSIKRLEEFLLLEEKDAASSVYRSNVRPKLSECGIWVDRVTAFWNKEYSWATLRNISVNVKPGELLAIVGPVGAGKSSLLMTLLGELPTESGSIRIKGKIAYVSQEPWLFSSSIRNNILFGQPYNEEKYQKILRVCALDKDIKQLPFKDKTLVGEKGLSLSGGQRARVNLARALYLDADIYLLDDPLSAVDTHVGRHLFYKYIDGCINGYLSDKVCVLVTHQLQFLKSANQILILKAGENAGLGSWSTLVNSGVDFANVLTEDEQVLAERQSSVRRSLRHPPLHRFLSNSSTGSFRGSHLSLTHTDSACSFRQQELEAKLSLKDPVKKDIGDPKKVEESKSVGSVSGKIYLEYLKAGGGIGAILLLVITSIITQILFNGSEYLLSIWTNEEENRINVIQKQKEAGDEMDSFNNQTDYTNVSNINTNNYIYIYSGTMGGMFIFSLLRTVTFFLMCNHASVVLHNKMFQCILRAPTRFFDSNPIGRILNRFSKDTGTMDDQLPLPFFDMISVRHWNEFNRSDGFSSDGELLDHSSNTRFGNNFLFLRKFYLATARDVKRLEGITRSPVFSHLSVSLQGLCTIRAFNAQEIFYRTFDSHQDLHSSAWFLFLASARWFGMWLDFLCFIYISIVTYSLVIATEGTLGGDVGLAISSAMCLTGIFQYCVKQSAEVENQMTSVERILEYSRLESEAELETLPEKQPPTEWPENPTISFKKVYLEYSENELPVLRNVNFIIEAKKKVGIVGRTGAGKSSIITALFRMTEPSGTISIDGISTMDIGLHDLRKKLSIIPQDPVLFTGPMRKNLDPFDQHQDVDLWNALEAVQLKDVIKHMPGGLDTELAEGGSNFSMGQRQLVCLARAILRKNNILVLDEATASIDPRTDALIQQTIRQKFKQCTVLTIAHRLNTIMDSDLILVMDSGEVKEMDDPYILLQDKHSLFYQMVRQTGRSTMQSLIKTAKQAHHSRQNNQESIDESPVPSIQITYVTEEDVQHSDENVIAYVSQLAEDG
uniref:Uncharacterized protein n=1 Tax=Strigamia maritima TaxID=126957 RepID=T1IZ26_STRMM